MFIGEVRDKHKHIIQMYFAHIKYSLIEKINLVPRENRRLLRRSGSFPRASLFLLCRLSWFGLITAQVSACGCHSSSSLRYANDLKCHDESSNPVSFCMDGFVPTASVITSHSSPSSEPIRQTHQPPLFF